MVKNEIVMIAAITLSILMTACNRNKNQNQDGTMENKSEDGMGEMIKDGAMQSGMSPMMTSYMEIKDALVSDDSEKAGKAAENMLEASETNDTIKDNLEGIAWSSELNEQRKHFSALSEEMYRMAKEGDMGETLYWNHCPMAMNNAGANWLSMSETISNPYMGQRMPRCGSVQETLGSN